MNNTNDAGKLREETDSDKLVLLADILSHCEERNPGTITLHWKRWDDSIGVAGMVIVIRRAANDLAQCDSVCRLSDAVHAQHDSFIKIEQLQSQLAAEKDRADKWKAVANLWEQAVAAMLATDTPEKYDALREQYELLREWPEESKGKTIER